jgi:hypothetical protein
LGVPAPFLLAPLLAGILVAVLSRRAPECPEPVHRAAQAPIGVIMGSYLVPDALRQVAPKVGPVLLVTLGTVAVSLAAAYALARTGLVSRSSWSTTSHPPACCVTWCSSPSGSRWGCGSPGPRWHTYGGCSCPACRAPSRSSS